jgi:cellulose biosynthesis protein BcsQ
MTQTLSFVGASGGAGTTRLAVETAATLARTNRDVAVLDAAFATQGLADYVPGRIDPDVTTLVTDDEPEVGDAIHTIGVETPGRISVVPARAPFERLARAKTAGAAERFEKRVAATALSHDVVIVDTPPVAANQAVAAVHAADDVVVVTPDSRRGDDALARLRGRLTDIGTSADSVVATFADGEPVVTDADARIPTSEVTDAGACPAVVDPDDEVAPAVADAAAAILGTDLDLEFEDSGRLDGLLDEYTS